MGEPEDRRWLRTGMVCRPCLMGVHAECVHRAQSGRGHTFKDTPCACQDRQHPTATTCRVRKSGSLWGDEMCDKPAKGLLPDSLRAYGREPVQVPACGVHIAAARRVEENDRRRRQEAQERAERSRREAKTRQAAADWAQRLQEEFGLAAEPERAGKALRVLLEPERLYDLLVRVDGALRDAGTSWREATGCSD